MRLSELLTRFEVVSLRLDAMEACPCERCLERLLRNDEYVELWNESCELGRQIVRLREVLAAHVERSSGPTRPCPECHGARMVPAVRVGPTAVWVNKVCTEEQAQGRRSRGFDCSTCGGCGWVLV